jgi:hypothetical protein
VPPRLPPRPSLASVALLLALPAAAHAALPRLVEVAAEAGLAFVSVTGDGSMDYIVEANGNGGAWLDYDGDGDLDVLLVSGGTLAEPAPKDRMLALYANDGAGRFTEVTARGGLLASGWGMGVCAADVDRDRDVDLYVTAWGPNRLFRNRGDGTFEEGARAAGVEDPGWSHGCAFGDVDRDGDLDLFVTHYVRFDPATAEPRGPTTPCGYLGNRVFCGPLGLEAERDRLFLNRGDGTFEPADGPAAEPGEARFGMGVLVADLDHDGWLDLFVTNDSQENYLYRSTGDGRLQESGLLAGVALGELGNPQASMGIAAGDYDRDGDTDLFVTNFSQDYNTLYRNQGDHFVDATVGAGLGLVSNPQLGWGTLFADLDHDGWLDLFVANGHVYEDVDSFGIGSTFEQAAQLLRNAGGGRFEDASASVGPDLLRPRSARGLAAGDLEGDGDLDLLLVQLNAPPALLRNDGGSAAAWSVVAPEDGLGATGLRAKLRAGETTAWAQLVSGAGYLSASAPSLHFGLGAAERVDALELHRPGARVVRYGPLPARRILIVPALH